MPVHRLSVDPHVVQHPCATADRRAIQSFGVHLARLCLQVDRGLSGSAPNAVMLRLRKVKGDLPWLDPTARLSITVAEVAPLAGRPDHADAVRHWT